MEVHVSHLLTLYILVLGPLKVMGTFFVMTANADALLRRQIATRAFLVSTAVALVVASLGGFIISRLALSVGTLSVTLGVFLAHWAWGNAMGRDSMPEPPEDPKLALAIFPISLPAIIPPQGIAMLVLSSQLDISGFFLSGFLVELSIIPVVMALNWVFMMGTVSLMKFPGKLFWVITQRVVAVAVAAMSLRIIVTGLTELGIV